MSNKPKFPELEAEIRRQGYTQYKLAEIVGMTATQMSCRLNGKIDFSLTEVIKISNVLNRKIEELFINKN